MHSKTVPDVLTAAQQPEGPPVAKVPRPTACYMLYIARIVAPERCYGGSRFKPSNAPTCHFAAADQTVHR